MGSTGTKSTDTPKILSATTIKLNYKLMMPDANALQWNERSHIYRHDEKTQRGAKGLKIDQNIQKVTIIISIPFSPNGPETALNLN